MQHAIQGSELFTRAHHQHARDFATVRACRRTLTLSIHHRHHHHHHHHHHLPSVDETDANADTADAYYTAANITFSFYLADRPTLPELIQARSRKNLWVCCTGQMSFLQSPIPSALQALKD